MAVRIRGTRFVYFPVPKCACTSVKLAILRRNRPLYYWLRARRDIELAHARNYWSMPFDQVPQKLKRGRAFCVVRDPIDRFISAYRNRIVFRCEAGDPAPDINTFALNLFDYCAASDHVRHHFEPMVSFLGRDPSFYDRVFTLCDLGDLPSYAGLAFLPRVQIEGPHIPRDTLSTQALARLSDFYAEDYRIWERSFA